LCEYPDVSATAGRLDKALAGRVAGAVAAVEVSTRPINRLAGRRVCQDCQAMYHVSTPPKIAVVTNAARVRRTDDEPDTVRNRLFVYYKQTSPLVGYYFAHGVLESFDGDRDMDAVQADLVRAVNQVTAAEAGK
jgi:adenylate kinase